MLTRYPYLHNNSISKPILESLQIEENTLVSNVQETRDQFFVDNATWGLDKWEVMLGIKKNPNLSVVTRRENIKAKLRARGTTSLSVIKNICESYSNGQVELVVDHANYSFIVRFIGSLGVPSSIEELDRTINEIKPCHLVHSYEYFYNTHSNLAKHTHKELSDYTHEQIRTSRELR